MWPNIDKDGYQSAGNRRRGQPYWHEPPPDPSFHRRCRSSFDLLMRLHEKRSLPALRAFGQVRQHPLLFPRGGCTLNEHTELVSVGMYPGLEIPVQPSDIEAILANLTKAIGNLGNVDFLAISKDLQSLILSARDGINALNLADLGKSLDNLVNGPDLKGALTSVKTSFDQLDATLKKLDKELDPISNNLNPTLEEAKKTMAQLQSATAHLDKMLSTNSSFRYQLDNALSQIGTAADSLRRLSEFLERNPNSIIFGRKPAKPQ